MKTSVDGRKRLTQREGVRLKAYKDSVGILTIGVGHTSMAGPPTVTAGLTITQAECDAIFARDLVKYEDAVNKAVKVPISQGEFDSLVSLCYNIGPGGFAGSTVVKRLNAGDRKGAAEAFMFWSKPPEIIGRRKSEQTQFIAAGSQPKISKEPESKPPVAGIATAGAFVASGGGAVAVQNGVSGMTVFLLLLGLIAVAAAGYGAFYWWEHREPAKPEVIPSDPAEMAENFKAKHEEVQAAPLATLIAKAPKPKRVAKKKVAKKTKKKAARR